MRRGQPAGKRNVCSQTAFRGFSSDITHHQKFDFHVVVMINGIWKFHFKIHCSVKVWVVQCQYPHFFNPGLLTGNISCLVQSLSPVRLSEIPWTAARHLPIHRRLLEFTQTHVHHVGEATQSSYPLSSPSPPAFSISQH